MAEEKKKSRSFFFRKKEVVSRRKDLTSLKRKKREIEGRLRSLAEMYHLPEEWADRLPVSTLQGGFLEPPEREDDGINFMELRAKIRDEHQENIDDLEKIKSEISVSQIDLLLAKIKCIEENLDTDQKK